MTTNPGTGICTVCGHTTARHRDQKNASVSCESLLVEDIARDLAFLDRTDRLDDPELRRHYLRAAWLARKVSAISASVADVEDAWRAFRAGDNTEEQR